MSSAGTRWLKLSLGLATTAVFVWLLARGLDFNALGRVFARLSVCAVMSALAAAHAVRIVRWWLLLRALEPGLPLGACVRPFLAGMAVNNVMPFRAGDALRVLGFRHQLRSPAMRVLGTVVIERAFDTVVLSGVFFLCLLGLPDGALPRGFVIAAAWLAGAGVVVILASILFQPLLGRLQSRWLGHRVFARRRWPESVSRHGAHLAEALALVRSVPRTLALLGLSIIVWGCEGTAFVIMAASIEAGVAAFGPWLSLAAGSLATAIPSAPGYIGTFDYFAALGLTVYGAAPEVAAALALSVHTLWAPLTVVGLLCLGRVDGLSKHDPGRHDMN